MVGGAFSPDISPDGSRVAFVSYEAEGQAVAVIPRPSGEYSKAVSPARPLDRKFFTARRDEAAGAGGESKPYLAFSSMLPRFIIPVYWTEEAYRDRYDAAAGFSIYGWDVLSRHNYGLSAAYFYDLQKRLVIDAYYTLSVFYPDISIGYYDDSIFAGPDDFPYEDKNNYTLKRELSRLAYASLYFPLYSISSGHGFQLSYIYENKMIDDYVALDTVISEDILLGRSQLLYSYSNTRAFTYSVSREMGREVLLFTDIYHSALASDYDFQRVAAQYNEYLPGFFRNHVTALLMRGAACINKPGIINSFSLGQYTKGSTEISSDIREEWGLRGYPGGSDYGCRLAAASLEYRMPLLQSDFALGMFPLMFRDLWLTVFADFGNVWNGETEISDFKSSAGAEIHTRFTVGYNLDIALFAGYARGFNSFGEEQFYFAWVHF